jgi:hypothetical protein
MPELSFGEVASWGLILGILVFVASQRLGQGPALAVAMLAALTTKAALLGLN